MRTFAAITLLLAMLSTAVESRADETEPICPEGAIAYQPWAQNLEEAIGTFGFVASTRLCILKGHLKVNEGQSLRIFGYREVRPGLEEVRYEVLTFKQGSKPTSDTCVIKLESVYTGKPHQDSMTIVVSKPTCRTKPLK